MIKFKNVEGLGFDCIVPKKWGEEIILHNDENYCGKLLRFIKGGKFSMHFHMRKVETWYINEGEFILSYLDTDTATDYDIPIKKGDVIEINTSVNFDLASGVQTSPDPCANTMPCPPVGQTATGDEDRVYYLVVRYSECYSRPERVPPAGCGCDETACEYARIRDGFELKLLLDLPESHQRAAETDDAWCREIKRWANSDDRGPAPIPPCPSCTEVPWVVLAGIRIPLEATSPITDQDINYKGRRVLYSVTALQTMVRCV